VRVKPRLRRDRQNATPRGTPTRRALPTFGNTGGQPDPELGNPADRGAGSTDSRAALRVGASPRGTIGARRGFDGRQSPKSVALPAPDPAGLPKARIWLSSGLPKSQSARRVVCRGGVAFWAIAAQPRLDTHVIRLVVCVLERRTNPLTAALSFERTHGWPPARPKAQAAPAASQACHHSTRT